MERDSKFPLGEGISDPQRVDGSSGGGGGAIFLQGSDDFIIYNAFRIYVRDLSIKILTRLLLVTKPDGGGGLCDLFRLNFKFIV